MVSRTQSALHTESTLPNSAFAVSSWMSIMVSRAQSALQTKSTGMCLSRIWKSCSRMQRIANRLNERRKFREGSCEIVIFVDLLTSLRWSPVALRQADFLWSPAAGHGLRQRGMAFGIGIPAAGHGLRHCTEDM